MNEQEIDYGECFKLIRNEHADMIEREKACFQVCAKRLEHFGYMRNVAGDNDFFNAVRAYVKSALTTKPMRKGLCIMGQPGCGKTTLLNAIRANMRVGNVFFRLSQYSDMMALDTHDENNAEWLSRITRLNIFLDDVGAESDVNDYGVRYNVVTDFIMRYNDVRENHAEAAACCKDYNVGENIGRLFISTNLTPTQLMERYGHRVCDRIKNLCVMLNLSGESRRQADLFGFGQQTKQTTTISGRA